MMKVITVALVSMVAVTGLTVGQASAADHTLTSPGLKKFDGTRPAAGINNPGRFFDNVPGQGSPLAGQDHTTPATDTLNHGQIHTNPAFEMGKMAPSINSQNGPSSPLPGRAR